ncbi:MAG: carbohydrate ABC transporter permease [Candidatus Faecivicinus sp.]
MALGKGKTASKSPLMKSNARAFYAFVSPWLIGFFGFTLLPMLYSLYAAFTDWNGVTAPVFTGLSNFKYLFYTDNLFWKSVGNTFYYACATVPLNMIVALFLAQQLNKRMPGSYLFRAIYYLPAVVSGVAVYLVWQQLYNPVTGVINDILYMLGINGPNWLGDTKWAMPALIFMNVFTCGSQMLILLAGLQDIPQSYYEAAQLDGASSRQIYFKVTLPLLTPVIFFNLIMGVIGALQIYTQPAVMTDGGPINATYVYGMHLYRTAFWYYEFGKASALAWVLFVIILLLSIFIFRSSRKWVHYGGEVD